MSQFLATATAHPNIALVKYWGKRDVALNLPAAGSISVTLDALETRTTVTIDPRSSADRVMLNGHDVTSTSPRIVECVRRLANRADVTGGIAVDTDNNFPTAAGLASSASGYAALVSASAAALGMTMDARSLSIEARRGSGSAARSLFGGYVELHEGSAADGTDCYAEPLADRDVLPLSVVIAITSRDAKSHSSTDGMEASRQTSPFYSQWVDTTRRDLPVARSAILAGDFDALADVSVHSCMKMHATMMATRPPLLYWSSGTVAAMHRVLELRAQGFPAFFTVDAGPQLKVFVPPNRAEEMVRSLSDVNGVLDVITVGIGGPARVVT